MAQALGVSEDEVMEALARPAGRGGEARRGGAAPEHGGREHARGHGRAERRAETVAALVGDGYPEVNHNYEREHELNLWFVATAPDTDRLQSPARPISRRAAVSRCWRSRWSRITTSIWGLI